MATITLPGFTFDCVMGMGAFEGIGTAFSNVKKSTSSLSGTLGTLKSKINLASVVAKIETSQEQAKKAEERESAKKSSLSLAYEKLNTLISDVGSVDLKASGKIRERKEAFYDRYYYLKPECEKTKKEKRREKRAERWQNFKDFCGGVTEAIKNIAISIGEWCKEHWESIVLVLTAVAFIVIVGVAASLTGGVLGAILAAAFKGALIGAVVGGVGNATSTALEYYSQNGTLKGASSAIFDSFASGFVKGTITGAVTGAISGITNAVGTAAHMKKIGNIALHSISGSIEGACSSSINYFLNNGTLRGASDEVAWSAVTGFALGIKGGFKAKYGYRGNQILYYKGIEYDQQIAQNMNTAIVATEMLKSSSKKAAKTYAKDKWNINLAFNWEDVVTNFLFEPIPVY